MDFYFAGCDIDVNTKRLELAYPGKLKRLYSYYGYAHDRCKLPFIGDKVFLDSGAFSAFTRGKSLDIPQYVEFIKRHERDLTVYAALDVIGDWQATAINLKEMESCGVKPLPTIHYGTPERICRAYLESYPYIALGGLVPFAKQKAKLIAWLDYFFKLAKEYWPVKLHAFGMSGRDILLRYPFYSADSTSWCAICRFPASVAVKDDRVLHYKLRTESHLVRCREDIEFFIRLEREVTDAWAKRGIVWYDDSEHREISAS